MLVLEDLESQNSVEGLLLDFSLYSLPGIATHDQQGGARKPCGYEHKRQQEFGT
jgi:hypothetical protein